MDDIYEITPEEEEDIKFQEKCEAQNNEAIPVCCDAAKWGIIRQIETCKYRKGSHYWDERGAFVCTNPNGCVGAFRVLGTLYCGFELKK